MDSQTQRAARPWGRIAAIVAGIALLAAGAWFVATMDKTGLDKPKQPPKISLMAPPPPPPPPPPKEEKKPEPPKEVKEIKVQQQQPQPKADQAPPSQDLKMDGPAGDGPSAFAAGQVTNEDLSKIGKGNGGAGPAVAAGGAPAGSGIDQFRNYANLIKGEVQRSLRKNSALRSQSYSVDVKVWVAAGGGLERVEMATSTGDPELDQALRAGLAALPPFSQNPPTGMAQPIKLRISAG